MNESKILKDSKSVVSSLRFCLILFIILITSCTKNNNEILTKQSEIIKIGEKSIPELLSGYELRIKENPEDPINYVLAATAFKRKESEELFKKAIELSPDCVPALTGLGNYYSLQENYEEALILYKKLIKLSPRNVNIKKKAIKAALYQNNPNEALIITGKNKALRIEYIHILIDQGKTNIAEEFIEEFGLAIDETAEVLALRGRLLYIKSQEGNDKEILNRGIELLINSWKMAPELIIHYKYVYPRKTLIQILTQSNNKENLKSVIKTGMKFYPLQYQLYDELWKYEFSDPGSDFETKREKLIEDLGKLLDNNPANPDLYKTVALGYKMADIPQKIEEINKKLLEEFPFSMASLNLRRTKTIRENDLTKRLNLQRKFTQDFPQWPYMYTNIFQTLNELDVSDEELLKGAEDFVKYVPYEHAVLKIGDVFRKRGIYIDKLENWLGEFIDDSGFVDNAWDARLLTLKSYLLILHEKYEQAETYLTQILDVNFQGFSNVDKAKVKECLGYVLEADKRPEEAMEYFAQAYAQSQHYLKESGNNFERLYSVVFKNPKGIETYLSKLEKKYQSESEVGVGIERGTEINKPAPEFELVRLNGAKLSLSSLKGKLIIMNFWATYCGPCIKELPHLQELYDKIKDEGNTIIITINCDKNPAFAEPFVRKNNYTFPVLYADSDLRENYGVRGIPTTFIIDATGEIKLRMVGFNPEEPFVPYLESLIAKYSEL